MTSFEHDPLSRLADEFREADEPALPSDEQFDVWIANHAVSVHRPGETPREAMWEAIQRSQSNHRAAAQVQPLAVLPRRRRWPFMAAIAAALVLGIALDRLTITSPDQGRVAASAPERTIGADSGDPSRFYRLAAVQTLAQAEALLTTYRAKGPASRDPESAAQLTRWGRDVLSSTRLLMDSPAGRDPQLRPLLNDVELVLVQIVRLTAAPRDAHDRALIDATLRDRDLLPRIQTAVPAGTAATTSND